MRNIVFLTTSLCLGLWIGCSCNDPNDTELLKMPMLEKWSHLEKGMSTDKVFEIVGDPQSSRASKLGAVYTFDCFLCTATFDSLQQLKAWHGPKK